MQKRDIAIVSGLVGCWVVLAALQGVRAGDLTQAAGVRGGLVVVLGAEDVDLLVELAGEESLLTLALDTDASCVARARSKLLDRGFYGRVTVSHVSDYRRLPLVGDQVGLLVVADGNVAVSPAEVARVLAPRGVLAERSKEDAWTCSRQPVPDDVDDWTHSLYDATGNMVSKDTRVDAPYHVQWMAGPTWNRYSKTSALVSAEGRIFYIHGLDHSVVGPADAAPTGEDPVPKTWELVARDAYSGVRLWNREIPVWGGIGSKKTGPAHISRLLVAEGDRVYVVPEFNQGVMVLDAATGEPVSRYAQTEGVEEFVLVDGMLIARIDPDARKRPGAANARTLSQLRGQKVLALDVASGETLWQVDDTAVMPTSLVASSGSVFFHNGLSVVCVDRRSGQEKWRRRATGVPTPLERWYGVTLVAYRDTLCYSCGGKLVVFDAESGESLWRDDAPVTNYRTSPDLFLVNDTVWTAGFRNGRLTLDFEARDLKTGERRVKIAHSIDAGISHHRCSRIHATEQYMVCSGSGIELLDFDNPDSLRKHLWARGSCYNGITPANGMLYIAPHNCACFIQAKLTGYVAMTPRGEEPSRDVDAQPITGDKLERGSAYGEKTTAREDDEAAWPTYRGDVFRSGAAKGSVAEAPKPVWKSAVGGRLTAPVVAEGMVLVASMDRNMVSALDAMSGGRRWSFVADGPIDSPPTIHGGLTIFGCRDGWVYCLRADDGRLVWRRRAAQTEERIVVRDRLESPWPVSGGVLVLDGVVYCLAGRSSYLDGGMRLMRIEAETGRLLSDTVLDHRDPQTGAQPAWDQYTELMPGVLQDVLSSDGRYVYAQSNVFDLAGNEVEREDHGAAHFVAPAGFVDDSVWSRVHWVFGRWYNSFKSGAFDSTSNCRYYPSGMLLVADEETVYGYGQNFHDLSQPGKVNRLPDVARLFAASRTPLSEAEAAEEARRWTEEIVPLMPPATDKQEVSKRARWPERYVRYQWSVDHAPLPWAMCVAGASLVTAGPAGSVTHVDQTHIESTEGSVLCVWDKRYGTELSRVRLPEGPVWDGMVTVGGTLYLALKDGSVVVYE